MYYDFYAASQDTKKVFDFIFNELDLTAYLAYSDLGQEMKSYNSTNGIFENFSFADINEKSINFQLWTPRFEGDLVIRKIDLDPKRCKGHTFRYTAEGWGLIQFYCGVLNNKLHFSHLGHQSIRRAITWQDTNNKLGSVEKWNWKEVETTGRKIKYFIQKKLGVKKVNDYDTLENALPFVANK